ncbi:hypothetical protein ACFL0Q_06140 [Thermodesulfobacteriota bacterium]
MIQKAHVFKKKVQASVAYILKNIDYLRYPGYYSLAKEAKGLYKIWRHDCPREQPEFVHSRWSDVQPRCAKIIENGVPYNFLHDLTLSRMFYRIGFKKPQEYEFDFLLNNVSEKTRSLVKQYRESPVGKPAIDCPQLGISVNSLGMLYYYARITEKLKRWDFNSIVEFGGGYASLCRVFLELLPKHPTYVIIDLPEILSLQHVFLRWSSNEYRVFPHTTQPIEIKKGFVNLVPVHLIEEAPFDGDLFISTFALSEAGRAMQVIITKRCFLNCKATYIVGQNAKEIDLQDGHSWESPEMIHSEAKRLFDNVQIEPFHFADAWELIGWSEEEK